jgi:hypothetical protein
MAQTTIFGPFFAMMFLTLIVWIYMYARRISFISANKINPTISPHQASSRSSRLRRSPIRRTILGICLRFR